MADRILVVKVRPQGWEKQEAAKLARNCVKKGNKKDKGDPDKTPNPENAKDSKTSSKKNDHKSQKGAKNVTCNVEPVSGASESNLSDIEVEVLASGSESSNSPVQEAYSSKSGTKRKKNNSEDSIVIPEDILLHDKNCKFPIDPSGEGCDLPFPSDVSENRRG